MDKIHTDELKFTTLAAYRCRHLPCKHDLRIQPKPDVDVPEDADASSIVRANIAKLFLQGASKCHTKPSNLLIRDANCSGVYKKRCKHWIINAANKSLAVVAAYTVLLNYVKNDVSRLDKTNSLPSLDTSNFVDCSSSQ